MKSGKPVSPYLRHYLTIRPSGESADYLPTLEVLEEAYIGYVLEMTGFDLARSSDILDLPPTDLLKKIKRLEIRL